MKEQDLFEKIIKEQLIREKGQKMNYLYEFYKGENYYKKQEEKYLEMEYNLSVYNDRMAKLVNDLHIWEVNFEESSYHDLWYGLNHEKEISKEDKRRNKYLLNMINKWFFKDPEDLKNAKFQHIEMLNFGEKYIFNYKIYKQKIDIQVPMYSRAGQKDWKNYKFRVLVYEKDSVMKEIITDMDRDSLADKLKEWLEKWK